MSIFFLSACNDNENPKVVAQNNIDTAQEKIAFFPVTSYLQGQIHDIREKGLTPIKYTIINAHTDSVMIKFDQLNGLMAEFLKPKIDSANMIPFYTESKFLDQTLDAFTFNYDAKPDLPDSVKLKHWDVYVDPTTSKIKRVYMVKKISADKQLQLTWQSNKWCKITTIVSSPNGASAVEKEEKISWDY